MGVVIFKMVIVVLMISNQVVEAENIDKLLFNMSWVLKYKCDTCDF